MSQVTPCAGVWIEMLNIALWMLNAFVTPCAGVWIEIDDRLDSTTFSYGHSLCGSVD